MLSNIPEAFLVLIGILVGSLGGIISAIYSKKQIEADAESKVSANALELARTLRSEVDKLRERLDKVERDNFDFREEISKLRPQVKRLQTDNHAQLRIIEEQQEHIADLTEALGAKKKRPAAKEKR